MFNSEHSRVTPRKVTCGHEGWRGQWEHFCRRNILGWSDGHRTCGLWEFNLRSESLRTRVGRCRRRELLCLQENVKVTPFFWGSNWCRLKPRYNTRVCECAGKQLRVEIAIIFLEVVWQYLRVYFKNVHTCFLAIPHMRTYLKKIMTVVCKDLASRVFNTQLFIIAKY